MARRKPKKKVREEDQPLPRRPRGELRRCGRTYEGAAITKCIGWGSRVAIWTGDGRAPDPPDVCGMMLGIQPRADTCPDLRVAVNAAVRAVPLAAIARVRELEPDEVVR